ncbi:uncharacterized protein LOC132308145 [Cornus florida]|uniref:uncharacterized protein LOC132308145 n=1 Tax=Cornus florida TaxID=4283 RepID=UPI002898A17F|nr:uncharacterized protein LOC132308145 [Cornus florida]
MRRNRSEMEAKQQHQQCPSPLPNPSSSLLKDISNFKTPKRSSQNPNFHSPCPQFFTASKETPAPAPPSSFRRRRPSLAPSSSVARSKVARRLKAFELEQSKSARKAQIDKEKSLRSLSRSLTVWLNFLFQNPRSCGCDFSKFTEDRFKELGSSVSANGKRDSWSGGGVGVDWVWRSPKRRRDLWWRSVEDEDASAFPNSMFSALQYSLREVCSFDDLKQRMSVYLSLGTCKEIFKVMTQVTKNIDEGRVKMKAHCPIVTDVGMKEMAMRILMCYNPVWLRIGLHIILGGDSLLPDGDVNSEQEIAFLRVVIEKQFFSHSALAKAYAYNKLVEGLYRPGYFEELGNIILKRFLLLVLILDRAKSQNSLPIKYGIDGLDGGSPLLFTLQSNFKSTRQVVQEFLSSDVMHGEGNLLAHLVIVGYKVSYQQNPLIEYDFRVTDLFEDLRDGVRLCRAIQLLQNDSSILMKMIVPSDTRKKNLVNCGIALQHLKLADVPLYDEDGLVIVGEDVVNGDKELTLSLLWKMFVHLQLPLLINKTLLVEEISKIRGVPVECSHTTTLLDMLLNWIQAICGSYDFKVDNFASLVDGKAMWCLLDYYFRKELSCSCSFKDLDERNGTASIMSASDYTDAVHNFILSQKLTTLLGNFPEVLQVGDILEHNGACNERSVIILLVFLSFQLIVKRNTDKLNFHKLLGFTCQSPERRRLSMEQFFLHSEAVLNREETHRTSIEDAARNFRVVMAWWQDMAQRNGKHEFKPATPTLHCFSISRQSTIIQRGNYYDLSLENAAKIMQSHFRRIIERRSYLRIKNAVSFLQSVIRAWLTAKKKSAINGFSTSKVQVSSFERLKQSENFGRLMTFMVDRHDFVKLRQSVVIIQRATRAWISRRHHHGSMLTCNIFTPDLINAVIVVQKCIRGWRTRSIYSHSVAQVEKASLACKEAEVNYLQIKAASKIQLAWKKFVVCKSLRYQHLAATKIQCHCRGWLLRKSFVKQKQAIIKIQSVLRCLRCWRDFHQYKIAAKSVIVIQSHVRGWIAQSGAYRRRRLIVVIQCHCRGWLARRELLFQKEAVIRIQSAFRCTKYRELFHSYRTAAIEIQRFVRGHMFRRSLLGFSCLHKTVPIGCSFNPASGCFHSIELKMFLQSVLKLQRWWRGVLLFKSRLNSAIIIQSHIREWIARRSATRARRRIIAIQSHCRGWLARRELLFQKEAVIRIQSAFRCTKHQKLFHSYRHAAIEIQRFVRGHMFRRSLLGSSCLHKTVLIGCTFIPASGCIQSLELTMFLQSVLKLQRWWRSVILLKSRINSVIIIQSHIRGWIARRSATRARNRIIVIQSYWKGFLARKDLRGQLLDLRLRVQKTAANVDDGMRIINRLVAALSELLSMKSVSGILHICATLDMATEHSQICCEELVAVGAVDTLLKLIRSVSRSIPDQEVLKHALSTLRNLARYPHLTEVLIDRRGSLETIFWEFLRNKEGYFIASELLKKICSNQKGVEAVRNLPALLKRLHNLVEDLTRKAGIKRNARAVVAREHTERRLREATELLKLITTG